jgi:thiol-disulfide isomerase/thioredoxin
MQKVPEFSFNSIDGNQISSDSIKGDATVICVWATWCGDCIREIPELNDLVNKYTNDNRVNFIALSDEDEITVRKSLKRFPFNFEHIVNSKIYSDQLITGAIKHFPQVIVIDDNLNVVYEVTENKSKIFNVLDSHIQEILNK